MGRKQRAPSWERPSRSIVVHREGAESEEHTTVGPIMPLSPIQSRILAIKHGNNIYLTPSSGAQLALTWAIPSLGMTSEYCQICFLVVEPNSAIDEGIIIKVLGPAFFHLRQGWLWFTRVGLQVLNREILGHTIFWVVSTIYNFVDWP